VENGVELMALPININELINGKTVEWERIELRKGWNPERTIKTITAFANDFNNWGGGYIIIGIEEEDGKVSLPPVGLKINQIDKIQKELNQLCRKIIPNYFYYLRKYSSTVKPTNDEERELISMSNIVPFDDRVNHFYDVSDFDLSAIKIFLNKVGSELEQDVPKISINELSRKMNIAEGSDEYLLPKNVGLLFFAKEPQKVFPSAKIEIVTFDDEAGSSYTENIFTGNLFQQLTNALSYLKNQIIIEKVVKIEGIAEADRFYNYPYIALEEALCNAVYHRGYDNDSTIEVRIYPSHIDIISFPGPLPPLSKEKLKNNIFDVRKYRNRRIGEFLKELHLTEGRATGIPTITRELKKNGSPEAVFETDDDRNYFKISFKINSGFISNSKKFQIAVQVDVYANFFLISNLDDVLFGLDSFREQTTVQVREQVKEQVELTKINKLLNILRTCIVPQTRKSILNLLNLINHTENYKKNILILIKAQMLERIIPDKPRSPKQKYRTTKKGKMLLEVIGE